MEPTCRWLLFLKTKIIMNYIHTIYVNVRVSMCLSVCMSVLSVCIYVRKLGLQTIKLQYAYQTWLREGSSKRRWSRLHKMKYKHAKLCL